VGGSLQLNLKLDFYICYQVRVTGEEVAGGWRTLHNEERQKFYASPNIIRVIKSRIRSAVHLPHMGDMKNLYTIFVGKPEEKRPLGRLKHELLNNIRLDLREIEWKSVNWIHLAQDRDQWRALVNTVMKLRAP
jgi:hypothetical protein